MEEWIKKSDAIDVIKKNHYRLEGHGLTEELLLEQIRSIPSVQVPPKPKDGEWMDAGTDLDGTHYYRCSNCGWEVETDYPNCPYCTAEMKGADDE